MPPSPAPATAAATAVAFAVTVDPSSPASGLPFHVVVVGAAPGEGVEVSLEPPAGRSATPRALIADASGTARIRYTYEIPDPTLAAGWTARARRSSGQVAAAQFSFDAKTITAVAAPETPMPTPQLTPQPAPAPLAPTQAPGPTPFNPYQTCESPRIFLSQSSYKVGDLVLVTLCLPRNAARITQWLRPPLAPPDGFSQHVVKEGVSYVQLGVPVDRAGIWTFRYVADGVTYDIDALVSP